MIKGSYFMFFVFAFLLGLAGCTTKDKDTFRNLSSDEFEQYIRNDEVQLVDVRTVAEYSVGHLPGSLNINVLDDSFASAVDDLLETSRPVAVYCKSGRRSRKAAGILTKKGFKVVNLDTGFENWRELGKEIEY